MSPALSQRSRPVPLVGVPRAGFTLLELIVVLILLALAAAVVAPSLLSVGPPGPSELQAVVLSAREAAIRRGEMVRLQVDRSGAWRVTAGPSGANQPLASGRLAGSQAQASDLLFSPLGTCAPSLEGDAAGPLPDLDPLTCEPRPS